MDLFGWGIPVSECTECSTSGTLVKVHQGPLVPEPITSSRAVLTHGWRRRPCKLLPLSRNDLPAGDTVKCRSACRRGAEVPTGTPSSNVEGLEVMGLASPQAREQPGKCRECIWRGSHRGQAQIALASSADQDLPPHPQ